jgi:hypothetical protein
MTTARVGPGRSSAILCGGGQLLAEASFILAATVVNVS